MCYELSQQEALTVHQVKAHGVRALLASEAIQSGVSLEQLLSACNWKSHNTFTQFYLWLGLIQIPFGACTGCSADPPVAYIGEGICINVYIVYSLKK